MRFCGATEPLMNLQVADGEAGLEPKQCFSRTSVPTISSRHPTDGRVFM